MKVLQVVTTEAPFFQSQVRALTEAGIDSTVISLPGSPGERTPEAYLRTYPRVLSAGFAGYDLVHANAGQVAPLALLQPTRPVVLSLWGSDLMGRYGAVTSQFARLATEVIVMSEEMNRALPVDGTVIPHGIDLAVFEPMDSTAAKDSLGWDPAVSHVLFPYNPDRAVKNYSLARAVVDRTRDAVQNEVILHVLTDVPHEEVPVYMNAADAMLLTSTREGSPNTVKEALACNLPVVATPVGDVPARLEGVSPGGIGGTRDELVDQLTRVLEAGVRSDGREAVEELGLAAMAEAIRTVYERAME